MHGKAFLLMCLSVITLSNSSSHTASIYTVNEFARFNLPKVPKKFYYYDLSQINFKTDDAYQNVLTKWQNKFLDGATRLFNQIAQELDLTPASLFEFTTNEQILARYHILKKSELVLPNPDSVISEVDMDPEVLLFLQNVFFKYTTKRNVKFFLTDQISTLTATYGSDNNEHFVYCHSFMYNKEHVQQYYESLQNQHGYYYIEPCENNKIRWIEIPTLLQIGLTEAASHVEHQANLLGFILNNYSFEGKKASQETIQQYQKLQEFHTLLEAVFQSRNPLETALFLSKMNHKSIEHKKIWTALVKDIAQAYDAEALEKMKIFSATMYKISQQ